MDYSVSFARHFARLVWLILHEPTNVEEQKAALRALVTVSRDGPVGFAREGDSLSVNGNALPLALPGMSDLLERLKAHGRQSLLVSHGASPSEILGDARTLALAPAADAEPAPAAAPPPPPAAATATVQALPSAAPPRVTMAFEALGIIPADETHHGGADHEGSQDEGAHAHAPVSGLVAEAGADMFFHFAGSMPTGTPAEILRDLDEAGDPDARGRALDVLVMAAEHAAREGRLAVAGELLHGLVQREARVPADAQRSYTLAFRRAAKGPLLRGVAALLPRKPELRAAFTEVIVRAGEDGADALIDQLTHAQTSDDRRVYFDVLLQLGAGVQALVHMLGDARWFVARNAAELLGEMQAKQAEKPLTEVLTHRDERVRRAATESLLRLNTPTSIAAVEKVAESGEPSVRVGAIAALGARRDGSAATTLVRALDGEGDEEVQIALLAALGKVASPDAVDRLIRAAEPEGRFFRKKSTAFRAAAVLALGEARTPPAIDAVRRCLDDKEKEVRDAALRAVANARRSTTAASVQFDDEE